jgi:hypothetical protein
MIFRNNKHLVYFFTPLIVGTTILYRQPIKKELDKQIKYFFKN